MLHFLCMLSAVQNDLLQIFRKSVELSLAHCDVNPGTKVSGLDEVLLYFIEGLALDERHRVFLRFDGALLQRGEYFVQSHRGRLCAGRFESCDSHRRLRGTDQKVLHISEALDLLVGSDISRAAGEVTKDLHAAVFHQLLEPVADFAFQNRFHLLVRLDQIRHSEHAEVRLIGLHGLAGVGDVASGLLKDGGEHIDLRAKLGVRVYFDFDRALGFLLDILFKCKSCLMPGVVLRLNVSQSDGIVRRHSRNCRHCCCNCCCDDRCH